MHRSLRRLAHDLFDLAFPPLCVDCRNRFGLPLCAPCRDRLPPDLEEARAPRQLDTCVAAVAYAGRTPEWMQRFKYPAPGFAGLDPAALAVACSLAVDAAWLAPEPAADALIPVPLHPKRLRARGFNPAGLLARAIADEMRVPCLPTGLRRLRDTPTQTGLDRKARQRNVRGAFAAAAPIPPRVWLVDDVVTTGATLSECARTLRRAGARSVVGVCAAATPRPD